MYLKEIKQHGLLSALEEAIRVVNNEESLRGPLIDELTGFISMLRTATSDDVAIREAETFGKLRKLMGYVENGSSESVTIAQDDATYGYGVSIGRDWKTGLSRKSYYGDTLTQAIDKAFKDYVEP